MARPLKALTEVLQNLFKKHSTSQYPAEKGKPADLYRARVVFKPEGCIGCQICVRNCPANAIKITQTNPQAQPQIVDGKTIPAQRKFKCDIDLSRCIFCAQCVESCPKKTLAVTQEFELAAFDKKSLHDKFEDEKPAETDKKV